MAAPEPVMVGALLKSSVVVPTFFTVTDIVLLVVTVPKASAAGDKLTWVPVPVSVTFCGELMTLSATPRVAVSVPVAWGSNSMEIVQLAPAAREVAEEDTGQVVELPKEKELEFVPEIEMPPAEIDTSTFPVFFSVTVFVAVLTSTVVVANVRLVGVTLMAGLFAKADTKFEAFTVPIPLVKSHPFVDPNAG